jgi:glycosyltransferase involved in cell wall biosynthesis
MVRGVPVIARDCGGMPEALGGGGVLYDNMSPRELAVLADRVCTDQPLRPRIIESQQGRLATIAARKPEDELLDLLR